MLVLLAPQAELYRCNNITHNLQDFKLCVDETYEIVYFSSSQNRVNDLQTAEQIV